MFLEGVHRFMTLGMDVLVSAEEVETSFIQKAALPVVRR